jgi:hypothetical protein
MAINAEDIRTYIFGENEELLLDANIWLLLYGPNSPGSWRVRTYSEAFGRMLRAHTRIHLEVLVISEFVNRFARIEHGLLRTSDPSLPQDFKQFRKLPVFVPVAEKIRDSSKRLVKCCNQTDSGFSDLALNELLDEFSSGAHDFNDQVLADLCKRRAFKLVTDDSDFRLSGINVITANAKLLH